MIVMRKSRKSYKRPKMIWNKERIERDKELKKNFGLVKKREIWKAETTLRKYRRLARRLAATKDKKTEKELMGKLAKLGILKKGAGLDDVLGMSVENILDRRLQTIVFKKGLSTTPKGARQLIVHGHVNIGGKKSSYPSYIVPKVEEDKIEVVKKKKSKVKKPKAEEKKDVEKEPEEDKGVVKDEAEGKAG